MEQWAGRATWSPEVGQQERHRLGRHRRAAVGVDGELPKVLCWLAAVSVTSASARRAFSAWASSQPGTYREEMSRTTYR